MIIRESLELDKYWKVWSKISASLFFSYRASLAKELTNNAYIPKKGERSW